MNRLKLVSMKLKEYHIETCFIKIELGKYSFQC